MRRRMRNTLRVTSRGVDLTTCTNIEFYIKQGNLFFQYVPEVVSKGEMVVTIPVEDAKRLQRSSVSMQYAFVDAAGHPDASNIVEVGVNELLKEAGYDPI